MTMGGEMADMTDVFATTSGFKSYVSKPEITALSPEYLVKGSKNVLIDYANRVISRNGYTLYRQANTGAGGIKGSYDWETSTAKQFSLRSYDQYLEFDWNGSYNRLMSGLRTPLLQFAKIWDNTEKIDVLLFVMGDTNTYKWSGGVAKVRASTGTTLTKQGVLTAVSTIAFVPGDGSTVNATLTDSANNFLNAGFAAGDTLYVSGSAANSRNFTIASVTAGTISLIMSDVLIAEAAGPAITVHNGEPTWAASRFLTTGTRKLTYNGVDYAYTGGEATDTLTGLTAFPAVSVGDAVWQTVQVLANPGAINANFKQDLIGVQLNQLVLASTKSQEIYGSLNTDYTNFTLTSPRAPGDPFKVNMDNFATCIIPIDNADQTANTLMFGGGFSEFFRLSFQLSQDNTNELVRMIRLKTAAGSGLVSTGAIGAIKNATAYISREPSLDTLSSVEVVDGSKNVPLSDPIKNDFDLYDFTGSHVKYWKRAIYISLPVHGYLLVYDLQRGLWQPPQTIPVGRLAIIGDWLYGHSSITNETYKLFVGTNDNGNAIQQRARFAYNNGGSRSTIKFASAYWSDGYITPGAELDFTLNMGFAGSVAKKSMQILGSDASIAVLPDATPIGSDPEGSDPLGGASFNDIPGLPGSGAVMARFYQDDTMKRVDYTEFFIEYAMDTLDGQFAIVAHGTNQQSAGTAHSSHKK